MAIERLRDRRPEVVEPMVAAARDSIGVWESMPASAWTLSEHSQTRVQPQEISWSLDLGARPVHGACHYRHVRIRRPDLAMKGAAETAQNKGGG